MDEITLQEAIGMASVALRVSADVLSRVSVEPDRTAGALRELLDALADDLDVGEVIYSKRPGHMSFTREQTRIRQAIQAAAFALEG